MLPPSFRSTWRNRSPLQISNRSLPRARVRSVSDFQAVTKISSLTKERFKNPVRGGQNLTARFQRLENTIRGKDAYSQKISSLSQPADQQLLATHSSDSSLFKGTTFAGFIIPEEPKPPADDECCMSGCAICVYDLYEDSLTAYKDSIMSLRSSLVALGIPEQDWPPKIRRSSKESSAKSSEPKANISLSAFEEMERKLREKRLERAEVEAQS
ncbi:hypothetical protein BJ138DRAFT_1018336 [Hygrophoropsis aurantiaca]|uniref:Uncharacterized protein n=1 Tax=Hygrophoropsis aurantiaca TaxID=72124 RepID=A0ACB7ZW43_9AGAM|nr:hypothetical protein BJ138DRAFT_1018336 [Hygrophoropsis aurantiaca]